MTRLGLGLVALGVSCTTFAIACEDLPGKQLVLPRGGVGGDPGEIPLPGRKGAGEDCSEEACRPGLVCENELCEFAMNVPIGDACSGGPQCVEGASCAFNPATCDPDIVSTCVPRCVPAGDGEEGDSCQSDLQCEAGLRCELVGFSSQCSPAGEADLKQPCMMQSDCVQGLYCIEGACSLPRPPVGLPLWEGVECEEQDDQDVTALFHVPGAKDTPEGSDFFSLPFPNDIRLSDEGRPDLSGFPTPGPGLLGFDIVERYVDAVETNTRGWSTNPTIIFRFSGGVNIESFKPKEGEPRRLVVTDLDALPDNPSQGINTYGIQYSLGSQGKYVCGDWFALRVRGTLVPGHRHVAFFTTGVTSDEGDLVARSPQFAAMLEDGAPTDDAVLAAAWEAYAPLREYIEFYEGSEFEVSRDSVLSAAVFTTDEILTPMRDLAEAVEEADEPAASDWVLCGSGVESPCPQSEAAEGRGCGEGTDDYDEYQARLTLPIFQEGTAPYLTEGGAIADSPVRSEDVCMSLSIPKTDAPEAGYPLVIYGHGTGGHYRSQLRGEIAGRLARSSPPVATIAIDQVQHGPRRGEGADSENDPETLFFNFANPDAARGNPLQGAADILSVLRFARSGTLASGVQTGGDAIAVDPDRVLLFGHSQGSTHASLALPFTPLAGGVFSGNGGGLVDALLHKNNPVDIASAIPFVIQDVDSRGELNMGDKHPVLALLQHYIDIADPINFAPLLASRPEGNAGPKSVLQTFGLDDTYSPPSTLRNFITAAGEMRLAPHPDGVSVPPTTSEGQSNENYVGSPADDPIRANAGEEPDEVTLACRQYGAPSDSDGHFVVFDVDEANDDAIGFLRALASGETPTVSAE